MQSDKSNFLWPTNMGHIQTKGFWEGLRSGNLLANSCLNCGEVFFPPRSHCPQCLGNELDWKQVENDGILHSWTEVHFGREEFDVPFLLGLVDLSRGIGRIAAKIVDAEIDQLKIGMPVKITYTDVDKDFTLYSITLDVE